MTRRSHSKRPTKSTKQVNRPNVPAKSPGAQKHRRELQNGDPRPVGVPLKPPRTLTKRAEPYWAALATLLASEGVTEARDVLALQSLVETYAELVELRQLGEERGLIQVTTARMVTRRDVSPEARLIHQTERRLIGLLGLFGMTPADRARLASPTRVEANEWDED